MKFEGVSLLEPVMSTRPDAPKKARENVPPTGVRLPATLRDELLREATIERRTLSQEIIETLKLGLQAKRGTEGPSPKVLAANEPRPPPLHPAPQGLSDQQRMLLSAFDALPPDKQLGLLTLLKR